MYIYIIPVSSKSQVEHVSKFNFSHCLHHAQDLRINKVLCNAATYDESALISFSSSAVHWGNWLPIACILLSIFLLHLHLITANNVSFSTFFYIQCQSHFFLYLCCRQISLNTNSVFAGQNKTNLFSKCFYEFALNVFSDKTFFWLTKFLFQLFHWRNCLHF